MPITKDNIEDLPHVSSEEKLVYEIEEFSKQLKELGILDDQDILALANAFGSLVAAGSDIAANKKVITDIAEHFLSPEGLEKRLESIAQKFPAVRLAIPFIKSLVTKKEKNEIQQNM